MTLKENYSLKDYNTFGINAYAKYFAEAESKEDISQLLNSKIAIENKKLILGGGSNILLTSDFDGLVIKINIPGIHVVKETDHFFWIKAGAGVEWQELVTSCVKANFGGIENLAFIPGTVGAAPIQNIGAYGVELKDTFEALEAIEMKTGVQKYFRKEECKFGYRDSVFKNELKGQYIVTNVVLRLHKEPVLHVEYGGISKELENMGITKPGIKDVSEAVVRIRESKLPDPELLGNAGSFFKNPIIENSLFQALKASYPEIPGYEHSKTHIKIPAGWLIEQCGLKGKRIGNVGVHQHQALVLVNYGNATSDEVTNLSDLVLKQVKDKFNISLDTEVNFI